MVGTIKTVESLGAAFSSLCGEQLAEIVNYSVAFGVLSVIAILPIIIYGCWMPSGRRNMFTGEMIEELSILPNQHQSSYTYPMYDDDHHNNIDSSIYSVDFDSSRTGLNQHHHYLQERQNHHDQQLQQQQQQQQQYQQYQEHQQFQQDGDNQKKSLEMYNQTNGNIYHNNNNNNNNNNSNNPTNNQKNNNLSCGHTTTRQIADKLSEM